MSDDKTQADVTKKEPISTTNTIPPQMQKPRPHFDPQNPDDLLKQTRDVPDDDKR